VNRIKVLQEREKVHSGKAQDDPRHGSNLAKGLREREQELKASGTVTIKKKIKVVIQNFQSVLIKA